MVSGSSKRRVSFVAAALLILGCGANHLKLSIGVEVVDLGPVALVPGSAPVLSPDARSVIYLRGVAGALPVVSRDIATGAESDLFMVPARSYLWTSNHSAGTLVFSVPNRSGRRQIVEYSTAGVEIRDFAVPAGYEDYHGCISPDGSTLAFMRVDDATGIPWLTIRSTSNRTSTTDMLWALAQGQDVKSVHWIDNTRILISSEVSAGSENRIQDIIDRGRDPASALGSYATPDPNGTHAASLLGDSGSQDVWLSRLDGAEITRVTTSRNTKSAINWSAEGRMLVYRTVSGEPPMARLEVLSLPPLQ